MNSVLEQWVGRRWESGQFWSIDIVLVAFYQGDTKSICCTGELSQNEGVKEKCRLKKI